MFVEGVVDGNSRRNLVKNILHFNIIRCVGTDAEGRGEVPVGRGVVGRKETSPTPDAEVGLIIYPRSLVVGKEALDGVVGVARMAHFRQGGSS